MSDQQRSPRPDFSFAGVEELLFRPLETEYRESYQAGAGRHVGPARAVGIILLAIVLGVGTTLATKTLRHPTGDATRTHLVDQVRMKQDRLAELQGKTTALNQELTKARQAIAPLPALPSETQLETATGVLTGPALSITLTDGPNTQNVTELRSDERVQDADVRLLVNALWESGAQGISINGRRLGPGATVRAAGDALLVDLQPVTSPYVVTAIGDAPEMHADIVSSQTGDYLAALRSRYRIGVEYRTEGEKSIPPVTLRQLRQANLVADTAMRKAG